MSVKTKIQTNTKTIQTKKSQQKFVRLNIDPILDSFLKEYEVRYNLLSRTDIIRMLLSEVQYSKKQQAKKDLVSMLSTLPKAKKLYSEDEMFQMLKESDLL